MQYSTDNGATFQAGNVFIGMLAGNYTVIVQDANGCTVTTVATVNNAAAPAITASAFTDVTCFGDDNGTINITANGGTGILQYSIDNGTNFQLGTLFNNLPPGNYNLVVVDINGCDATSAVTISEPNQITSLISPVNTTCGNNNGSFSVNATGGTGNYEYSSNNGTTFQPSSSFNNLLAGSYNVVIQDANGCETDYLVNITDAPAPSVQNIATIYAWA